ncbi:unnamed protein product [Menidia menidia]|uniref:(Atlantic silverside) hypothetical protein n=1 Tax=Menidia menidia TaxID=238744 RepID=A0A8S4BJU3_9TELE|nr:unnamed protein product [Menidia menidia]
MARPNYFTTMKNFALQQPSEEWMILEFSQLGFIEKPKNELLFCVWKQKLEQFEAQRFRNDSFLCAGKMFKSLDLSLIVEFMLMFYKDKPIDWLLDHIMWVKVCNPEKDADDIVARPNYFTTMKNFALQQPSEEWMILEFSQLGFIVWKRKLVQFEAQRFRNDSFLCAGKMFKSLDLSLIVEFMLMFYKDKPIDWLLDHIMWVKVCNPEKDAKHCDRQKANLRIRFKPSLFQHVGTHSSLAGKIQKLKVAEDLHDSLSEELQQVFIPLKTQNPAQGGVAEGEVEPSFGPLEAMRLWVLTDSPPRPGHVAPPPELKPRPPVAGPGAAGLNGAAWELLDLNQDPKTPQGSWTRGIPRSWTRGTPDPGPEDPLRPKDPRPEDLLDPQDPGPEEPLDPGPEETPGSWTRGTPRSSTRGNPRILDQRKPQDPGPEDPQIQYQRTS